MIDNEKMIKCHINISEDEIKQEISHYVRGQVKRNLRVKIHHHLDSMIQEKAEKILDEVNMKELMLKAMIRLFERYKVRDLDYVVRVLGGRK